MATNGEIEKLERRWLENPLGLTFAPLAEAYRKTGDLSRALELLETGLAQHPNYVPAHIVRGRCHQDARAGAEAGLAFTRVIELDPENVIALKALADLAETEGRRDEAIARLTALLEVDRSNEEAQSQLARLRELQAAPEAAAQELAALKPFEPADLRPVEASELRVTEEGALLDVREERLPEIVLQEEVLERSLPEPEAAQGRDLLAAPDPLAATGEPVLDDFDGDPIFQALDDEFPPFAPDDEEVPEPLPEPAPDLAVAPVRDAALGQEAEPGLEPADAEPELLVTETMAEIFLRQGHRELALAVYTQLLQRDPANQRVAAAAAGLRGELAPAPPAAAPDAEAPPPPAAEPRRYAAAATGGRSVLGWLGQVLRAERPAPAAAVHPPAFEAPPRRAPEGAAEPLSLSAVFGDDGPAGPAAHPAPREGPSFEQFYASETGPAPELPRSPESEASAAAGAPAEDLEQFNAWLRSLKR